MNIVKLFFCYAQKDKQLQSQLLQHLSPLVQTGRIIPWDESEILPGTEWKQEIAKHLKTSDIVLLLISPSFISSPYCSGEEMQIAFQRHETKEAHVIPVCA